MRHSAAANLPASSRLRELIDRIEWGLDAAAHPRVDQRRNYVIALLPHQARIETDTKIGARLVDTHLEWRGTGSVLAIPRDGDASARWRVLEQGCALSGTATFSVGADGSVHCTDFPAKAAAPLVASRPGNRRYNDILARLIADGSQATWALTAELEPYVRTTLEASNRRVAREIEGVDQDAEIDLFVDGRSNHGAVDSVTLEKLAGELLYGASEGSTSGESIIIRMCRRAAATHAANQPLASYFSVNISRAAEEVIRREIGDPHIGRKVRRLQRELELRDIDELLIAYNLAHPQDELGRKRAIAALSAGKTIDSTANRLQAGLAGFSNEPAEIAAELDERRQLIDGALEAREHGRTLPALHVQVLRALDKRGIDLADKDDHARIGVWFGGADDPELDEVAAAALSAARTTRAAA